MTTSNISDTKYQIDTPENRQFLADIRQKLLDFGRQFPSPGGSSYYLGDDGTPRKDRPRETWITSRMAHVYSIASLLDPSPDYHSLADSALRGLCEELHDTAHGGWYAGLQADGTILPDKQCYAHAFVILAACSGVLAKRPAAQSLLEDALAVYDKYFWNEAEGLSCDTWNTEFTVLDDYRGLNANMHTVEAFLAVADTTGNEIYRQRAGRIIKHVLTWARANDWRIPEHFRKDWTPDLDCNKDHPDDPFKPYGATPGHGIEWARLITQWALSMRDKKDKKAATELQNQNSENGNCLKELQRQNSANTNCLKETQIAEYLTAAESLYQRAIKDAWNADGAPGIVYTTDWQGQPVVHDRMHWTLAEAINTSAVLWHVAHKQRYADDYAKFLRYLDEKVLDHVHGSWYHQLDAAGNVLTTVWPGKSDLYHAVQATLIPYYPADTSIAAAVARL